MEHLRKFIRLHPVLAAEISIVIVYDIGLIHTVVSDIIQVLK